MRSNSGILRRGSAGIIYALLAAITLLSWSFVRAQSSFAPVYRAGVSDTPVATASASAQAPHRCLFVVAGDVRAPGVFYTERATVTAGELIERAGGSSTMYEPMVHRVHGVRVVETLGQREASHWELTEGEIVRVVGSRGVRDARIEPLTTTIGSHVVCLGLAQYPVLIQLPAGRATLGDLFDIVGQSRDLANLTLVLPVRVDPRGVAPELDPGTLVIFPSEKVNLSSIPGGAISPPAPLDPEAQRESDETTLPPSADGTTLLPSPIDRSVPDLLPSQSDPPPATTSPLFVPAPTSGPTASSVPFTGGLTIVRESAGTDSSDHSPANTHEVSLSHSVVAANAISVPRSNGQDAAHVASVSDVVENVAAARSARDVSQVAIYTAALAVVCLALAGIWTYWDRMRSIATLQSFSHAASLQGDAYLARGITRSDHIQALIDNKVPIVEEAVEAPRSRQFHGEAWGQRRLRLDNVQPLAGPHAAFHAQPAITRPPMVSATSAADSVQSEPDARQLQRVMAHLTAEQTRTGKRRTLASVQDTDENDSHQTAETSRHSRESSLERALRQVMRKGRS